MARKAIKRAQKLFHTKNDIAQSNRVKTIALINSRLADAIDLQMQLKQAHWNVKGPSFIGLHKLFDEIVAAVGEYVDQMAERVVQLGGTAMGTVRISASRSRLKEYPLNIASGMDHVAAVAVALSAFGREARASIDQAEDQKDMDTADIFTEVSRGIDKWLWFVEAHGQVSS